MGTCRSNSDSMTCRQDVTQDILTTPRDLVWAVVTPRLLSERLPYKNRQICYIRNCLVPAI